MGRRRCERGQWRKAILAGTQMDEIERLPEMLFRRRQKFGIRGDALGSLRSVLVSHKFANACWATKDSSEGAQIRDAEVYSPRCAAWM